MNNKYCFLNFLRGENQAHDIEYMVTPVRESIKLAKEYNVPVTFMLQYDALIDDRFISIIKAEDPEIVEVGAWFETPKQLVEAAGIEWRGREGFTWDWYNEVGFLVGYTPEEREKMIDEYFKKFKEIWGEYPEVVGSWHIDAHSLNYMAEKYNIIGSCMCRDQVGTDGYSLFGGYHNPYYPSKNNMYLPAIDKKNRINIPLFKMLGEDLTYNYDHKYLVEKYGAGKEFNHPNTMEPAFPEIGGNPDFVRGYMDNTCNSLNSKFCFSQVGQENGFGWGRIGPGLNVQFPIFKEYMDKGLITFQKFSQIIKEWRANNEDTPSSVSVAEKDRLGGERKSYWCYNKKYRVNVYTQKKYFWIRDIYFNNDNYKERHLTTPCTTHGTVFDALPAVDGFNWSNEFVRAGIYPVVEKNGKYRLVEYKVVEAKEENGVLTTTFTTDLGEITVTAGEMLELTAPEGVNWQFRYAMPHDEVKEGGQGHGDKVNDWDDNIVKWNKDAIYYVHNNFKYKLKVAEGKISKKSRDGEILFETNKGKLVLTSEF